MTGTDTTLVIQGRLDLGTDAAWEELLALAWERFVRIARVGKGKKHLPEDTDDLVQKACLRLFRTPPEVRPRTALEYFGFVALQIRRELVDLLRKSVRRREQGGAADTDSTPLVAKQADSTNHPEGLAPWAEFHAKVEKLPEEEREVFDLLWYHELGQGEVAAELGISLATVKRRRQSARRRLYDLLGGQLPF